jgi:hypothetical protein
MVIGDNEDASPLDRGFPPVRRPFVAPLGSAC